MGSGWSLHPRPRMPLCPRLLTSVISLPGSPLCCQNESGCRLTGEEGSVTCWLREPGVVLGVRESAGFFVNSGPRRASGWGFSAWALLRSWSCWFCAVQLQMLSRIPGLYPLMPIARPTLGWTPLTIINSSRHGGAVEPTPPWLEPQPQCEALQAPGAGLPEAAPWPALVLPPLGGTGSHWEPQVLVLNRWVQSSLSSDVHSRRAVFSPRVFLRTALQDPITNWLALPLTFKNFPCSKMLSVCEPLFSEVRVINAYP